MDLTEHMVRVIGMMADMPFDAEAKAKYSAVVDKKLPGLNWAKPGTPCNSGMMCLKDYQYDDLVVAEFEDAAKANLFLERVFTHTHTHTFMYIKGSCEQFMCVDCLPVVLQGPMERNFPTASQKHLEPMLMDSLPRTKLLLHYWSGPEGDGHLFNEDGTFKEERLPYIAPKDAPMVKKRFARDEL